MPKHIFQFACPCCGKDIEVNTRSGKARAVDPKEARGGQDLDSLVQRHKHEGERLKNVFDEAQSQHRTEKERLEDLFGKAVEKTKQDPKAKPPSPFDLE